MSNSEQTNELGAALSKAQGAMKNAVFNRQNPHFKNKYADLAAVWDAIRKPLADNGLSITQTIRPNGTGLYLCTTMRHSSGQWVDSSYPLPTMAKPQEMGSALTYARRYSLSAIVGIAADEDDDAELATKGNRHANKPEEFIEHDIQYDENGQPIDNIPAGAHGLEKLSKAMGRPEYAKLLADIKSAKGLAELELWGKLNANRVATLPDDWQVHLRDEYRSMQISLGWKPKE